MGEETVVLLDVYANKSFFKSLLDCNIIQRKPADTLQRSLL